MAICLAASRDEPCDEESATAIEQTDDDGAFSATILAGPLLQRGQSVIIVRGLESGVTASRTFRALTASADALASASRTQPMSSGATKPTADAALGVALPLIVSGGADGWQADYYDNPDLSGQPVVQRKDASISFDWADQPPADGVPAEGFSVRWLQQATIEGRRYTFQVTADGGVRLNVDGVPVVNSWEEGQKTLMGEIDLLPGEHTIEVSYFNSTSPAGISVSWSEAGVYPEWRGEYFANGNLGGSPALVRNDSAVNFNWGRSGPAPGLLPADMFSARWTRSLAFDEALYRWTLSADDGARLLLDGEVVIDAWQGVNSQEVSADWPLGAGDHQVVVELRNEAGPGGIVAAWSLVLEPTATPDPSLGETSLPPTATPTAQSDATATPTETVLPETTATPAPTTDPNATDTPTVPPGSTATHTPTPTATVDPSGTPTPTPTATTGNEPTGTPTTTPTAMVRFIDVNPSIGLPGDLIRLTTGDWTPGLRVSVSLVEPGQPYSQAVSVAGTITTTPANPANGFTIEFEFPDDPRWEIGSDVWIIVHNSSWTEWGRGVLELNDQS